MPTRIISLLTIALAFITAAPASAQLLANKRPNIILILTDDQGYGDASCNGNPILKTPNIDRLHAEGRHFEDFHVSPTCSPTRSSIMSGRHEFRNGITHTILERERMSLKSTTIAQVLKDAGYATGIFGKWHLGDEPPYWPSKRGFDETFFHGCGGIGQSYAGSCGDFPGNQYNDPCVLHNGTIEKTSGYCTDVFFAQAMKWIAATKGKQPFFAYITPNAPHGPLVCPAGYERLYADKVDANAAKFFGMIANIDDNVGKLLAKIKELGIDNDTLVIFINDNGGTAGCKVYNAGMMGTKGTPHNGGTRAMSLWRWPGTIKPGPSDRLTAHLDIFPTLAELAGAKIPQDWAPKLEGFTLVPLLENPAAPGHDDRILVAHVGRWPAGADPVKYGGVSLRWQQYLMVNQPRGPRARNAPKAENAKHWALYDLKADPGEKDDLAAKHPEVIEKLDKAYDQWWDQTLPLLENEQAYKTAPKVNPMKELYWKQFAGPGPNNAPRKE